MTENSQFLEIVIFALIAIFFAIRLKGVLGKRTGKEGESERFRTGQPPSSESPKDTGEVIDLSSRKPRAVDLDAPPPGSLAAGLYEILRADPDFSPEFFEQGAAAAFEMIVKAFAEDDEETLQMLLSKDVFNSFASVIADRKAAGKTCENRLVNILGLDLVKAGVVGHEARITVRFVSEQIFVTKNANGAVVEGDPDKKIEITDLWTFARDLRSPDPNWILVVTDSPQS